MSEHDEVQSLVALYVDVLSDAALAELRHQLDHGEHEVAFEGLVIELSEQDTSPGRAPRAQWLGLAQRLGLREHSVLVGDLWGLLEGWLARHERSAEAPDLVGLVATLLGLERGVLEQLGAEALSGAKGFVTRLESVGEDLRSGAPERQQAGRASLRELEQQLRALGVELPGGVEGRLGRHGEPLEPDEGRALLARGLGVLQAVLEDPARGEAVAQEYSEEMEARFGHLVASSDEGEKEAELRDHVRQSIARSFAGIQFE